MNFLKNSLADLIRQLKEKFAWLAYDGTDVTISKNVVLVSDATAWDDIATSLIGQRLYSSAGGVDYDYAENAVVFSPGGSISNAADRIVWTIQTKHQMVENGELRLHIHFEDTGIAGTFTVQYRIQDNGTAKNATWTTVTADCADAVWTHTTGTLINILPIVAIDMTGTGVSAQVQFRMARTDSETGDINVTFCDCHYEIDSYGSDSEYTK